MSCDYYSAVDVTGLAVAITVALGVGIFALLAAVAVHFRSRRRVERLRQMMITKNQRHTSTSRVHLPDDVIEVLRDRRRRGADKEMIGFEYTLLFFSPN